jgi:hypothetical protein
MHAILEVDLELLVVTFSHEFVDASGAIAR